MFDTDDDGTFDDQRDFQPGVGRHTLVLKGGDGTAVATVRQTFPVAGPAQSVGQGEDQGQTTPPPAPQPAPAPKGDPKPSLQLAIKSLKHTARGVTLRTTCSAACRTTIVVKLGSKTLARKTGKGGAVTVKFSAKVRRQLAKARGRKLTITLSAPGAKSVSKTVKVNR